MSSFNIHFLREIKDSTQQFKATDIIEYLELKGIFRITSTDDRATIYYDHPRLPYTLKIIMSKGSIIPNLYSLNPAFRDIKVHVALDPNTPNYVAREFLVFTKMLADRFDFYTYNEYLEDVSRFNLDIYLRVFTTYKDTYFEKNPAFAEQYMKVSEVKMGAVLRYLDDKLNLEKFFKDVELVVPRYQFLKTFERKIKLAMNWVEGTATIFPPFIDYIYYRSGELIYLYNANEVFEVLETFLENVPGFIKEARLLSPENVKKATKAIKRAKLRPLIVEFTNCDLGELVD